jgi:hypothetical protein
VEFLGRAGNQYRDLKYDWQKVTDGSKVRHEDVIIYPLIAKGEDGNSFVDAVVHKNRRYHRSGPYGSDDDSIGKMMSVGGLSAGMAYKINNPLPGMMQNTQVIYNRLSCDIPANLKAVEEIGITMDDIRRYMNKREILQKLNMINETGNRSAAIVKSMFRFSRKSDAIIKGDDISEILKKL